MKTGRKVDKMESGVVAISLCFLVHFSGPDAPLEVVRSEMIDLLSNTPSPYAGLFPACSSH